MKFKTSSGKKADIVIIVQDGIIQTVLSNNKYKGLLVQIRDYDTENVESSRPLPKDHDNIEFIESVYRL